jgi:hypothetical protein
MIQSIYNKYNILLSYYILWILIFIMAVLSVHCHVSKEYSGNLYLELQL